MKKLKCDVLVIGGGAAGLFSAGTAASFGADVILIEKSSRLGWKLSITGKGRCNVTNNCTPEEVQKNIPRNPRFLFSALQAFPPSAMMAFLEGEGCKLKTERGNRVFPVSDRAGDVVGTLEQWARRQGVRVVHTTARSLIFGDGRVMGAQTLAGEIEARRVILCTGGRSYPTTGSDGSGYALAEAAGHTLIPTVGSLVPLEEDGDRCAAMTGLSLRNVGLKLRNAKGKTVYEDFGELQFASFGMTGPTVLSASAHMKAGERYRVEIDLKPALDEKKLDARILRDFEKYRNLEIDKALTDLLPQQMIPVVVSCCEIPADTQANSVTREQRRRLLETIKCFTVPVAGKRPVEEAIVTSGGVKVSEVDPKTMASKKVPGLYFAGEILDVDAYTGGFNLQIAWSTAHAAGTAAGNFQTDVI